MVSAELLAACRRGESQAFEEVVRSTYRHVFTQALRLVGDRQEAEDVAQEAYLRVYRALPGFREEATFETWLYRIVANAAMTHLRRKGRFGSILGESEELEESRSLDVGLDEQAADRDRLSEALGALPLSMRTVVVLKDVYGLSCREIGEELGISEGAVKVRLHRARRRLQERLFRSEDDSEL